MKRTVRTVIRFALLIGLSCPCYSRPKDVLGWENTRWGMTDQDIVSMFGAKAEKQPDTELYDRGVLGYVVPGIELKGRAYAAFFQMNDGKLSGVDVRLLEESSPVPRDDVFYSLESLLTDQYGPSDSKKDEPPTETPIKSLNLSRIWKFPSTTVQLLGSWSSYPQGRNGVMSSTVMIRYFPNNVKAE